MLFRVCACFALLLMTSVFCTDESPGSKSSKENLSSLILKNVTPAKESQHAAPVAFSAETVAVSEAPESYADYWNGAYAVESKAETKNVIETGFSVSRLTAPAPVINRSRVLNYDFSRLSNLAPAPVQTSKSENLIASYFMPSRPRYCLPLKPTFNRPAASTSESRSDHGTGLSTNSKAPLKLGDWQLVETYYIIDGRKVQVTEYDPATCKTA